MGDTILILNYNFKPIINYKTIKIEKPISFLTEKNAFKAKVYYRRKRKIDKGEINGRYFNECRNGNGNCNRKHGKKIFKHTCRTC